MFYDEEDRNPHSKPKAHTLAGFPRLGYVIESRFPKDG